MATEDFMINQHPDDMYYHAQGLPVHDEYGNYVDRWKYLIRSYLGGAQYKIGKYLTRYVYETQGEFNNRLSQTPLDNHCKSVVHIYNSFLYRNEPRRDLGSMEGTPEIERFFEDCDMEGRTWESFMRDVNVMSSIYGHCCVLIDRPETVVGTKAEELQQGIRPYVTLYTPEQIIDWHWKRLPSGHYELQYVKFLEQEERTYESAHSYHLRTWTKDEIILERYEPQNKNPLTFLESKPNPLGKIPAVWVYAARSPIRGIGVSDIGDIADMQNAMFQEYSEIEQLIRLTNHPTLVKTPETEASAGAGAIISMPNETDPGLKPYLLQPNGSNLDAILKSIEKKIIAIDKMAHLGAIRNQETRQLSGVSMQSEFILLDSKLCEKAKNLQLAEEQIWRMFALWQGTAFDGSIKYPMAFHIRDKNLDMDILKKAAETQRDSATASPEVKDIIDTKIKEILAKDQDELDEMNQPKPMNTTTTHPPMESVNDMIKHMREMVSQGFTDEQIKQLHPEMEKFFSNDPQQEI